MQGQTSAFAKSRSITLRRAMTDAERRLWRGLRHRQLGIKWRRQLAYDRYILDFVCVSARLVVEVDGSQHLDAATDAARTRFLKRAGFRLLRFWNHEVLLQLDDVLEEIVREVEARRLDLLDPSPPWPSP